MALTVGEILAFIGVDDSKLDSGLDKAEGKFKAFAKKAAVLGAAAGTALTTAVIGAMNVEQGTDKLAAQLGLTAKESERLGGVAGRLYAGAWGDSLGQVNDAVGAVVSSIKGMRTASSADVEAMSAKVLDLATAFEIDAARAAQIAGQMITSGIAKDGGQAMDLLVASMQRVPAAVREDLLDAVDEYGPFMESIGIKGAQAMGLLVEGAEKGMFGIDKTGDALKEFTIRATDMSTASKEGFDILGLSQENMTKKLLAGGNTARGAFGRIITGLQNIQDPAKQSQAALALFGTPLEDLSVSEIPEFLESLSGAEGGLGRVGGAAERMGDTLNDNANTNLKSFGRQAKQAFVGIVGGQVLPAVNTAARFLATEFGPALKAVGGFLSGTVIPALKSFGEFIERNQTPVKIIAGIITAIYVPALIAAGVAAVRSAAQQVAAFAAARVAGIKTSVMMGVTAVRVVAGWVVMGTQALLHAGRVALAWLIALGPVGLVIAAVVGLVALIIANWDKIWRVTKAVFTAVWNFLKGLWDKVTGFIGRAIGFIKDIFFKFHPVGIIIKNWQPIWNFIRGLWDKVLGLVKSIPGRIRGHLSGMWSAVSSGLRGALNFAIGLINTAIRGLNTLINTANKLPGVGIPTISEIPRLAKGGIVTAPTLALLGEGGGNEAVIPLPAGLRALGGDGAVARRELPDEFTAEATIDLGEGIEKRIELTFRKRNRGMVRRVNAGTGRVV